MMQKKKPLKVQGVCSYCKGVGMVPDFDNPVNENKVKGKPCPKCSCPCESCKTDGPHSSDCSVHNGPAYAKGDCDCKGLTLDRNLTNFA